MKRPKYAAGFSVGFVLFVATCAVVVSLFWVGSAETLFSRQIEYVAYFPAISGLKPGSRVYLSGVPVGTVREIEFSENLDDNRVRVVFAVKESVRNRIREDSFVWVQTEGLLGDAALHIALGSPGSPVHDPAQPIEAKPRTMLAELAGEEVSENINVLLANFTRLLQEVNRGEGTLGKMLREPKLYDNLASFAGSLEKLTQDLRGISEELSAMVRTVREGRGTLGKLLFSEEYERDVASLIANLRAVTSRLDDTLAAIERGEGALGKLLTEDEIYADARTAVEAVSKAAGSTADLVGELRTGRGVLGRLIADETLARRVEDLVARLDKSAESLETILGMLERGEGSLGIALHDPSIALSIRDLFLGVQEFGLVRNLVRSAEEEGRLAWLRRAQSMEAARREALRARYLAELRARSGAPGPEEAGPGGEGRTVPAAGRTGQAKPQPAPAAEREKEKTPAPDAPSPQGTESQ